MSDESIVLTREQLYEAVWKGTIKSIAAELGTSAAELVRACDELDVPRPAAGHWSRVALGYREEPPPLPAGEFPSTISLRKREPPSTAPHRAPPVVRTFPHGKPHPVSKAIDSAIEGHTDVRDGTLKLRGYGCAVLKVSKEHRKRAILIFDALFRACDENGYKIHFAPPPQYGPYELKIRSQGEEIGIGVSERITQVAGRWRDAQELRAFLQAVNERIPDEKRVGGVLAWLEWARSAVDELDPLAAIERVPKEVGAPITGTPG